jgi:PAS domain S-box-containing protein
MTYFPILSFFHLFAFFTYLSILLAILYNNPRAELNRVAAALFACFAVWSFGMAFIHVTQTTEKAAEFFEKFNCIGWSSFPVFALWFMLLLTGNRSILGSKFFYAAVIILPLVFISLGFTGHLLGAPVKRTYGWYAEWQDNIWSILYYVYYLTFTGAGLFFIFRHGIAVSSAIVKKQMFIFFWATLAILLVSTAFEVVLPLFKYVRSALEDFTDVYLVLWGGVSVYIFFHYKMLSITPETAAENIIASMTELVILLDEDMNITYANAPALVSLGYKMHDLKGAPLKLIFTDQPAATAVIKATLENGFNKDREFFLKGAGSVTFPVMFSTSLLKDDGDVRGIICVATNISLRKEAETRLKNERDILKKYLDIADVFFLVQDNEGKIILINKNGRNTLGLPEKDIIGKRWVDTFVQADSRESAAYVFSNLVNSSSLSGEYEYPVMVKGGKERDISWSNSVILDESGRVKEILSAGRDITESKAVQEQLSKLSTAVEQSPASVVITDIDGTITYVNPKFTQVTGYSSAEAVGKNPRILKSGEWPKESYKEMWDILVSGKSWHGEFHNKKKNGELFWESSSISSIQDLQGNIISFIAVKEDITEQKKSQQKLQESYEKLKELDVLKSNFTSMVSHELRTPLTSIKGFLSFLLSGVGGKISAQQKDYLEIIKSNSDRLLGLINDLLDTSKMEAGSFSIEKRRCDLIRVINDSIKDIQSLLDRKKIGIIKKFPEGALEAGIDEYRISQSVVNLINNAIKFSPFSSTLTIEVNPASGNKAGIPEYADLSQLAAAGPYIRISITDQGAGIEGDDIKKLFTKFYQIENINTRSAQGTGLGLNIVKNIINLHGGAVWVESQGKGKGSTFVILIPKG